MRRLGLGYTPLKYLSSLTKTFNGNIERRYIMNCIKDIIYKYFKIGLGNIFLTLSVDKFVINSKKILFS